MKKVDRLSIQVDQEARDAFDYLKSLDYSVSALIKRMLKEKAAEIKAQKEGK
jgi:hypothetical protein